MVLEMQYNKVTLWKEPSEILQTLTKHLDKHNVSRGNMLSGMSGFQRAFLCGLIKEKNPKKIMEVGVDGGGTTAVIMNAVKLMKSDAHIYSIDVSDENIATGINGEEFGYPIGRYALMAQDILGYDRYDLFTGGIVPDFIESIGTEIDFLILDTMHYLPGEILDFLVCLPYLSSDATVVLHDVILNHVDKHSFSAHATGILFDSITADKYYMLCDACGDDFEDKDYQVKCGLPNIAAFQLNEKSRANILDVLSSLLCTWEYMPTSEQLKKYKSVIHKHYPKFAVDLYDRIEKAQISTYAVKDGIEQDEMKKRISAASKCLKSWLDRKNGCNLVLYGSGKAAKEWLRKLEEMGLPVGYIVVSNDARLAKSLQISQTLQTYMLKDAPDSLASDLIIVAIYNSDDREKVVELLEKRKVKNILLW